MNRCALLAMLVGCGDAADGGKGAGGDAGPQGPPGEPGVGALYRWHDADGEQVTEGSDLLHFDDDGNVWAWDIETAKTGAVVHPQRFYEGDDCDGAMLVTPVTPRFVLSGALWDDPNAFYVRADEVRLEEECAGSLLQGGYCSPDPVCAPLLRFEDLQLLDRPSDSGFTAPLHPEPL